MKKLSASERRLFFGIWIAIALVFTLWRFWPSAIRTPTALPSAHVARELAGMFSGAEVAEATNSAFEVRVKLLPEYRARLSGEKRRVWLKYRLSKEELPLFDGEVEAVLDPASERAELLLPNPLQVRPTHIFILTQ